MEVRGLNNFLIKLRKGRYKMEKITQQDMVKDYGGAKLVVDFLMYC